MNPSQTLLREARLRRGLVFGVIIIVALLAFEMFNYSTTDYALSDLLGDLKFMGLHWSTILAIAFCGIDFAGIARLFTPADDSGEAIPHTENWYLFGAWLLAATMNAMLTWWGVSLAVMGHEGLGNEVVSRQVLLRAVPVFVAVLVWLIRVLIIGTFSVAGDRLLYSDAPRVNAPRPVQAQRLPQRTPAQAPAQTGGLAIPGRAAAPRAAGGATNRSGSFTQSHNTSAHFDAPAQSERNEPTYHPVGGAQANPGAPVNGRVLGGGTGAADRGSVLRSGSQYRR